MTDTATKSQIKAIPDGMHGAIPHLICENAAEAYAFYQSALGASAGGLLQTPQGKVMHAMLYLGGGALMLVDEFPEFGSVSPQRLGGTGVTLHLYVADVDQAFQRAINAGCSALAEPEDQFWGDRYGKLRDPFGHEWSLASHIRDVSNEEIQRFCDTPCEPPQG